jgi:hypothetical protein
MIAKVLFPVDFSSACVAMAPYAKRAADLFDARVTMVHVCDLASHNGFELCVRRRRSPKSTSELRRNGSGPF